MKSLIIALVFLMLNPSIPVDSTVSYSGDIYAKNAVVVEVDYGSDIVTAEDSLGFQWGFYGCDGYAVNDTVELLMCDNDTPGNVFDDLVLDAR